MKYRKIINLTQATKKEEEGWFLLLLIILDISETKIWNLIFSSNPFSIFLNNMKKNSLKQRLIIMISFIFLRFLSNQTDSNHWHKKFNTTA